MVKTKKINTNDLQPLKDVYTKLGEIRTLANSSLPDDINEITPLVNAVAELQKASVEHIQEIIPFQDIDFSIRRLNRVHTTLQGITILLNGNAQPPLQHRDIKEIFTILCLYQDTAIQKIIKDNIISKRNSI